MFLNHKRSLYEFLNWEKRFLCKEVQLKVEKNEYKNRTKSSPKKSNE